MYGSAGEWKEKARSPHHMKNLDGGKRRKQMLIYMPMTPLLCNAKPQSPTKAIHCSNQKSSLRVSLEYYD